MASNKRTYPNKYFAWYNDDNRLAIVSEDVSSISGGSTTEKYDTFQGTGNLTGTITGVSRSGTTATYTTSAAHSLEVGDKLTISGTTDYNDEDLSSNIIVSTPLSTTFTMTLTTGAGSTESGLSATFTSLHVDKGLRVTYHSKYGTIDAITDDLKTDAGLDSGLHPSVLCYVRYRLFEDIGDLQRAEYYRTRYEKMMKQYPLRKTGVRFLSVPRL